MEINFTEAEQEAIAELCMEKDLGGEDLIRQALRWYQSNHFLLKNNREAQERIERISREGFGCAAKD